MLTTLKNAFKIKELRNRLLFTFAMMVVIRFGSQLPTPGVKSEVFAQWFAAQTSGSGGAFSFFDAITGGSFSNMAILALGINPYITSSIIMQLLTIAIPKLEEMQKDGEDGRKKIASITRYVTVGLALLQSTFMAIGFNNVGYMRNGAFSVVTAIAALTAGSAFLMWIGERITEHGIGNGISIVLTINIISRLPQDLASLFERFVFSVQYPATAVLAAVIIIAVIVAMVVMVVYLNSAIRKIPVQYAKKMQGKKMVGGQTSSIPLRVNTAGVIPVIFAQSIMQLPILVCSLLNIKGEGFWAQVLATLNSDNWVKPSQPIYSIGLLIYIALIIAFAYFYTSITFNPLLVADNMKRQGGFIPGIRPGKPTSDYLNGVLNYIVLIGAIGLTIVSVVPYVFNGVFGAKVSFGGTSLIIIVSVVLETVKQAESLMLVRNYKGFLES